jgi:hypothetical protein
MAEYIAKTCNFSSANGPYQGLPYNVPRPATLPYHPQGFIMVRTDFDYAQNNHFCPQCNPFFIPASSTHVNKSYSCEGGKCVLQQRAPGPGYYSSMSNCQQNCPSSPYHHGPVPPFNGPPSTSAMSGYY